MCELFQKWSLLLLNIHFQLCNLVRNNSLSGICAQVHHALLPPCNTCLHTHLLNPASPTPQVLQQLFIFII